MKRMGLIKGLAMLAFVIFSGLSVSSCASAKNASAANQRKGFMLMNKSEYSMNRGRYKEVKKPKAKRKRKRNAHRKY